MDTSLNPLQDDNIFNLSILKVFADERGNKVQMIGFVFQRIENIVGKRLANCIFSFSHIFFLKPSPQKDVKTRDIVV